MFFVYGLLYTLGFVLMLPVFAVSAVVRTKHAAGFFQRLGFLPEFKPDARAVVWIHCVSVGETNAARPLVDALKERFPDHRIIVSTVTRTGQNLAREIFKNKADCVFYVPFDFRWTVRRALKHFEPKVLLLMETELWFNLIRETNKTNASIAIVNGRLSQRSFDRYAKIKKFMKRILEYLDLALMQENADATRIMSLGLTSSKVKVLGNIKFDYDLNEGENALTEELRDRFGITPEAPLIIAASTHSPEEKWILDAFQQTRTKSSDGLPRLMIVPRHPERFADVAELIKASGFSWIRRSEQPSERDKTAQIILLDTIGELRAAYALAEIVIVGGSLIPHGGQSIYEPASAGKAIITGPHTSNFAAAVDRFLENDALIQLGKIEDGKTADTIASVFSDLLSDGDKRRTMAQKAAAIMAESRGTSARTVEYLEPLLRPAHLRTGRRS